VGIDPLAPNGSLSHALERLSAHGPCPVVIVHCDDPTSREAAVALWYCCAEATTNTAKHAAPGAALRVDIRRQDGRVTAVLADDGSGGADPRGRGLRGLVDRVETLGGTLSLTGESGMGTVLTIDLPDHADLPAPHWGHPLARVAGDDDVLVAAATYGRDNRLHGGAP
jgi:signal transduction histidine kinase